MKTCKLTKRALCVMTFEVWQCVAVVRVVERMVCKASCGLGVVVVALTLEISCQPGDGGEMPRRGDCVTAALKPQHHLWPSLTATLYCSTRLNGFAGPSHLLR